jgi:subtilisin family serine protease
MIRAQKRSNEMKKTSKHLNLRLVCTLIVLAATALAALYAVSAQNRPQDDPRVKPDLREALARLKSEEFVRVIIRLKDQLAPQERAKVLAYKDKRERRRALVKALRAQAERSQGEILKTLKELEGEGLVRNVRPLWISNVIGAEIRPRALEALLRFQNIEYLKQDIKRPVFQAPAWGVSQINADDVWALATPYTGNGVVVAVLDTGIDFTHPDLANRVWINTGEDTNSDGQFTPADNNGVDNDGNGFVDDVVGWDFGSSAAGDNSPTDWNGHGTHVAGTIAGDGTGGTATGVAPGARLMALSYSATIVAGQAEAWAGMQYALANGADIVSFSSGWQDGWSPDYVTWRRSDTGASAAGAGCRRD